MSHLPFGSVLVEKRMMRVEVFVPTGTDLFFVFFCFFGR